MSTACSTNWSPGEGSVVAALLANDSFVPRVPERIEDTGLSASLLEALICKQVAAVGATSGHQVSRHLGLSLGLLQPVFDALRTRQVLVPIA